jgi:hypothetical protein
VNIFFNVSTSFPHWFFLQLSVSDLEEAVQTVVISRKAGATEAGDRVIIHKTEKAKAGFDVVGGVFSGLASSLYTLGLVLSVEM